MKINGYDVDSFLQGSFSEENDDKNILLDEINEFNSITNNMRPIFFKCLYEFLLDNDANKIFIPNKTQILNRETGVKYILILPSHEYVIDISKPLIKHEFKIVEGSIKINTFYSEGLPFETFHVNTSLLFDKNNIKVLVNNIQYTLLDCIYDMSEGSNECVFSVGYDNDFSITFGNGIYGKKLTEGQTIKIEWLSHNGSRGNVYSNDTTKFSWQSKGRDSFGNSIDLNKFIKLKMNYYV